MIIFFSKNIYLCVVDIMFLLCSIIAFLCCFDLKAYLYGRDGYLAVFKWSCIY